MKTPTDVVKGKITGYNEHTGIVTIEVKYDDIFTLCKRQYSECLVQMIDARNLSYKQRNACYALMREIAEYTGNDIEDTKEIMKMEFMTDEIQDLGDRIFSLSNAPMSLVCAFQRYLARFIVKNDIPCSIPLLDYVDDINDYVYSCLVTKKCCICGKHADLHHVDAVGAGRDREDIIHEGMRVLPLCREHHMEAHSMGQKSFNDKYHLDGGIVLDKTLCRLYKLKARKEEAVC